MGQQWRNWDTPKLCYYGSRRWHNDDRMLQPLVDHQKTEAKRGSEGSGYLLFTWWRDIHFVQ